MDSLECLFCKDRSLTELLMYFRIWREKLKSDTWNTNQMKTHQ